MASLQPLAKTDLLESATGSSGRPKNSAVDVTKPHNNPVASCSVFLYKKHMLTELFTSKTRIKLLLKLFLNPHISCYLRELSSEFAVSPNAIKGELDSLSNAGYLEKEQNGRSTFFRANKNHPFFPEIHSIVRKTLGIDQLLEDIIKSLGTVEAAYILDDYALGKDSGIIDLLLVGDINQKRLDNLRSITENKIKRKIRTISISSEEFDASDNIYLSRPHWQVI